MAKYHLTAEKLREKYNLDNIEAKTSSNYIGYNYNMILDLMRGCSQLRQSKVIESFFKECFKEIKTEYITIELKDGRKFQKLKVIE